MEVDDVIVTEEALKLPENVAMEDMEVTRMGDEPIQEVGAPVRPRVPSDPVIGVTPAVDDERKRKRTQPVFLDMEAAAGNEDDKAVDVIPPPSPVPFIAMQPPSPVADIDYNQPPAIPVQEDPSSTSPSLDLQPQGAKWGMYLHTWVCIHTFFRNWVCKRYVFDKKGM